MHRVFVYGTLKRGFPYHQTGLAGQRFLAVCRTLEAFPLVIAGPWFSPVLIAEPGAGRRVLGELYAVDGDGLALLDRLEGTHLPGGYERIEIAVSIAGAEDPDPAWTYVKAREGIGEVHTDFLEEYRHDPHYVPASRRGAGSGGRGKGS
ncbi:MAG: gamma-glutamylcyclotransferase family protein [Kiloniellales bacterium]|nr:gamma-glutamylcyclotransferase family protein [Kiloniellales bacterium]